MLEEYRRQCQALQISDLTDGKSDERDLEAGTDPGEAPEEPHLGLRIAIPGKCVSYFLNQNFSIFSYDNVYSHSSCVGNGDIVAALNVAFGVIKSKNRKLLKIKNKVCCQ